MKRLLKEALYHPDELNNSREVQEGCDRWFKMLKIKLEKEHHREKERKELKEIVNGNWYLLKGHFIEDGIPIPLEEDIQAKSDEEALKLAKDKAEYYKSLEGYKVSLNVFDRNRKSIGCVYAR